jgi:hypothetical protein
MSSPRFYDDGASAIAQSSSTVTRQGGGMVVCPIPVATAATTQPDLYRMAYEQAQATVRASWFERMLAVGRN